MSVLKVSPGERVVVHEAEVLEPGAVEAVLRLDGVHAPVHRHLGAARHQPVPAQHMNRLKKLWLNTRAPLQAEH